jgi:hypothetical protein
MNESTATRAQQLDELMSFEFGRSVATLEVKPLPSVEQLKQAQVRLLSTKVLCHREPTLSPLVLESLFSSLHSLGQRVVVLVRNTPARVTLTFGVIVLNETTTSLDAASHGKALERIFQARFPGSEAARLQWQEIQRLTDSLGSLPKIGALVGLPSIQEDESLFSSVIGDMLHALSDKEFAYLLIADPLTSSELNHQLDYSQGLLQQILASSETNLQWTRELAHSNTESRRTGWESQSAKEARFSQDHASGTTQEYGHTLNISPQIQIGGIGFSAGGYNYTSSQSDFSTTTLGRSLAASQIQRQSESEHQESSQSKRQIITENRVIQDVRSGMIAELLKAECHRLMYAGAVGAWRVGSYVLGENTLMLQTAAQLLKGALSGQESIQRPLRLIEFSRRQHPHAHHRLMALQQIEFESDHLQKSLQTVMHSRELGVAACFPTESVPGIEVRQSHGFGQWFPEPADDALDVALGCMVSYGRKLPKREVAIDLDTLTMHGLVIGTTGSGKTNTVMQMLLAGWREHNVPFLVMDPKEEYKRTLADQIHDLRILNVAEHAYRINPFRVPKGRSIVSYAEQLKCVFCSAFETEAAIPDLILQAILEVYCKRGWDLKTNQRKPNKYPPYPTLKDLQNEIPLTVKRNQFKGTLQSNYQSAIGSRIRSLRAGWKAGLLDGAENDEQGLQRLLKHPTVIDTGQMDPPSRSFFIALLLLQLSGIRRQEGLCDGLKHLLVLEEAHQLLRNPASLGGSMSSGRLQSIESILEAVAELRAFGQGILVVDQSPQELHPAILRGTNLKICHKLIEGRDQDAAMEALGLPQEARQPLSRLKRGHALMRAASWPEAIEMQVNAIKKKP